MSVSNFREHPKPLVFLKHWDAQNSGGFSWNISIFLGLPFTCAWASHMARISAISAISATICGYIGCNGDQSVAQFEKDSELKLQSPSKPPAHARSLLPSDYRDDRDDRASSVHGTVLQRQIVEVNSEELRGKPATEAATSWSSRFSVGGFRSSGGTVENGCEKVVWCIYGVYMVYIYICIHIYIYIYGVYSWQKTNLVSRYVKANQTHRAKLTRYRLRIWSSWVKLKSKSQLESSGKCHVCNMKTSLKFDEKQLRMALFRCTWE